jgi:hypothetical protein
MIISICHVESSYHNCCNFISISNSNSQIEVNLKTNYLEDEGESSNYDAFRPCLRILRVSMKDLKEDPLVLYMHHGEAQVLNGGHHLKLSRNVILQRKY